MITFCGNCAQTEIFMKTQSDGLNHQKKIHIHTSGYNGMLKKSNFELNLQKWVCHRNPKFQVLHILSQLKNINPLIFPWNTHY